VAQGVASEFKPQYCQKNKRQGPEFKPQYAKKRRERRRKQEREEKRIITISQNYLIV
jgi:hypothetical protein